MWTYSQTDDAFIKIVTTHHTEVWIRASEIESICLPNGKDPSDYGYVQLKSGRGHNFGSAEGAEALLKALSQLTPQNQGHSSKSD